MTTARSSISIGIVAGALLCSPVQAQRFTDPGSGFAVNPPAPFTTEQTSNRRQFDVGVGISSTTGRPRLAGSGRYVCEAGFKAAPQNASLSRAEINALVDKPEWVNIAKATFELIFRVTSQRRFTLEGYRGLEFEAIPKAGPGAEDVRVFISVVETAKGRTTLLCLTQKDDYKAARPQFRAIRGSINLPK
jgi:hypothetical protein